MRRVDLVKNSFLFTSKKAKKEMTENDSLLEHDNHLEYYMWWYNFFIENR